MKVESTVKQKVETKDDVQMLPEDANVLSSVNMPFSDVLNQQLNDCSLKENNFSSLDIDYSFDSVSMSLDDALFFVNLTKEGQFSVENTQNGDFKSLIQIDVSQNSVSTKNVEVTNQLTSLIEKAQQTQKPVRIAFDNDVSVVLKIDKNGKVSAEFIPGSVEVENYLRNNIDSLKQRFDEQNLPYNDLLYRQNNKQNRNRNNKRGEQ
jgi:hypothetical protein